MRSRLVAITLGLYLSFALAGCNSNKPSDTAGTDTSSPTSTASTPAASTPMSSSGSAMSSKAEARQPVVLPTGTTLTVRLRDAVGSKISQPGQAFSATLASAVEVDGRDVIPAGATASGVVVDAAPLGRFKGGARLQLKLTSINVKGTDKAIQTSSI